MAAAVAGDAARWGQKMVFLLLKKSNLKINSKILAHNYCVKLQAKQMMLLVTVQLLQLFWRNQSFVKV